MIYSLFVAFVTTISLFFSGCSKQTTSVQENASVVQQAERSYANISSKYSAEKSLLQNAQNPKMAKKVFIKRILAQKTKSGFWEKLFSPPTEHTRLHSYLQNVERDIQTLVSTRRKLLSLKTNEATKQAALILELRDFLGDLKDMIISHREFRDEARYIDMYKRTTLR